MEDFSDLLVKDLALEDSEDWYTQATMIQNKPNKSKIKNHAEICDTFDVVDINEFRPQQITHWVSSRSWSFRVQRRSPSESPGILLDQ